MARIVRDRSVDPSGREPAQLCGLEIDDAGWTMLLELYRRADAGLITEVCHLIGLGGSPAGPAYRSLDVLIEHGLVNFTSAGGRRFRGLELAAKAMAGMREIIGRDFVHV